MRLIVLRWVKQADHFTINHNISQDKKDDYAAQLEKKKDFEAEVGTMLRRFCIACPTLLALSTALNNAKIILETHKDNLSYY